MRPRARTVVIFLLTLALLVYFLRDADPAAMWAETRRADPWLLFAALGVTALTYLLRAWRWQSLLAPIGPTRFGVALKTTIIGFAASGILPARAGEVIRPYLLARSEGLPATAAFATIILERLLDMATVLLLFTVFVYTVPPGTMATGAAQWSDVKFWSAVSAAVSVAGLAVLFALAGHPERLGRAALRIERVLPAALARTLASFVEAFAQGLAVMRDPARLLAALVQSFPLWLSIAAGIWLTSQAFHITFPFTASFLVATLLVVGVAVPTPGAIGGFHAAYQIAVVTFFGAPDDRAKSAAIVLHAISFIPVMVVGLALMAREGLTLSGARKMAAERDPAAGGPAAGDPVPPLDAARKAAR
jgi:glycosyltransferase 2 family protein